MGCGFAVVSVPIVSRRKDLFIILKNAHFHRLQLKIFKLTTSISITVSKKKKILIHEHYELNMVSSITTTKSSLHNFRNTK